MRIPRKRGSNQANLNDVRVKVIDFGGRLDFDEFLEWLHTVERVFDYKETLEDKTLTLVALKL